MFEIMLTMFGYWALLGFVMAIIMFSCLQFAQLCEYIVDFFFIKK